MMRWPHGANPGDVAVMEDMLRRAQIIQATQLEMARVRFHVYSTEAPPQNDILWRTFDNEQDAQLALDGLNDLYQATGRRFYLRAERQ